MLMEIYHFSLHFSIRNIYLFSFFLFASNQSFTLLVYKLTLIQSLSLSLSFTGKNFSDSTLASWNFLGAGIFFGSFVLSSSISFFYFRWVKFGQAVNWWNHNLVLFWRRELRFYFHVALPDPGSIGVCFGITKH